MLETFSDIESTDHSVSGLNLVELFDRDSFKSCETSNAQLPPLEILGETSNTIAFLPSIDNQIDGRENSQSPSKSGSAEDINWASSFCPSYALESLPMKNLDSGTTLSPSERLEWMNVVQSMAESIAKEDKEVMAKIMQAMKLCKTKELASLIAGAAKALRWSNTGTTSDARLEVTFSDLTVF